jgi:CRP-like cAMP-binding protein
MFGETSLLDGRPRAMTVRALEKSTCCRLSRARFNEMRKRDPSLTFHLLATINRISASNLRNAYEVLAEFERG